MSEDSELFELCKEVYEKTGWENDIGYRDTLQKNSVILDKVFPRPNEYRLNHADKDLGTYSVCPLYTSDYLLEKLKHTADEHAGDQLHVFTDTKGWSAKMTVNYTDEDDRYHFHETSNGYGHDTPLKALLKLAIALDDSGVELNA